MKEDFRREVSTQEINLDHNGHEMPNPTPMQPPVGYRRQKTIAEQMREMIRQASLEAAQAGAETEEEANDFDVGEDMEPSSPWESDFEPDPALDHMIALASRPPQQESPPPATPVKGAASQPAPSSGKPSEPSAG